MIKKPLVLHPFKTVGWTVSGTQAVCTHQAALQQSLIPTGPDKDDKRRLPQGATTQHPACLQYFLLTEYY